MSTKVKICGLTNWEDAHRSAEWGADYLGFIFYSASKRAVTPAQIGPITAKLRKLPHCPILVGVFVNESAEKIAEILADCQLDLAQLSGDEPPSVLGETTSPIFGRAYKAIRPQSYLEAEADAEWFIPPQLPPFSPSILVDAYHPQQYGGTGQQGDWQIAAKLAQTTPRLMLAGGLNPSNVAQALAQVRPFGVDVASGVEARPGQKDHDALRTFITEAKRL